MNETQVILYAIGAAVLLSTALLNHITDNWLLKLIGVKISKGKKSLVGIIGETHTYYTIAKLADGMIKFRDATGEERRVAVDRSQVFRSWSVNVFYVDEKDNKVLKPDFTTASGFDSVRYNNLIKRALMLPRLDDKKILFILIGVGLIILGLIYVGYKVNNIEAGLQAINTLQATTTTVL